MFLETPLDKLRYVLYKYTQDFQFIDQVPEDVIVNRATRLLNMYDAQRFAFYDELRKAMDEYVEDVLLNRPV